MGRLLLGVTAIITCAAIVLAGYVALLRFSPGREAYRYDAAGNAVMNGDFSNKSSISYIHGFRLSPATYCPEYSSVPSPIDHRWGVLYNLNMLYFGNQSKAELRVSNIDARNALLVGISSGDGGRISVLQLLGNTRVNSTTRVHFAVDTLNSTTQEFSSVIVVLGPLWFGSNGSFDYSITLRFHVDTFPNRSGWYDFDFSFDRLMRNIAGTSASRYTFGGPCLDSRGVGFGLTASSEYANSTFFPSPSLRIAITDVAVYDSAITQDTTLNGKPVKVFVGGTDTGVLSKVPNTTYDVYFTLPAEGAG